MGFVLSWTGSGDPFNGGLSGGGDVMVDLSERYSSIYDAFVEIGYNVTPGDFLEEFAKGYSDKTCIWIKSNEYFCISNRNWHKMLLIKQKNWYDSFNNCNAGEGA